MKQSTINTGWKRFLRGGVVAVLALLLAFGDSASFAQRGGGRSFGGGGSFGGSRSFGGGGGSFGGGRSSGGSFGGGSFGGSRSFGGGSSSSGATGSFGGSRSFGGGSSSSSGSSFGGGRTGSFGSSGISRSTSLSGGSYNSGSRTYAYGGTSYPIYPGYGGGFWGGYSLGYGYSPWHWMPFHPAFYVSPPYYDNGVIYPGGFSFIRFFFGIFLMIFFLWIISRIFFGGFGGGKRVRYTTYN